MKVYVLTGGISYEGSRILGIYKSESRANRELKECEGEFPDSYDYFEVDEYEIKD